MLKDAIITPSQVFATEPIKSVTWTLPMGHFEKDKMMISDENNNFAINLKAWKPFELKAIVELDSGKKLKISHAIALETRKQ